MRRLLAILLLCAACSVNAQMSYYWTQLTKKPDAAQSQAFFFVPGAGINFTYQTNVVIINATGGGGNTSFATNALYAGYATNWTGSNVFYTLILNGTNALSTNALYAVWSTNWVGSNALWQAMTNYVLTNSPRQWATNLLGLLPTNGIAFYTNAAGALVISNSASTGASQTNIYATNLLGFASGTNVTFSTNGSGTLSVNANPAAGFQTPWLQTEDAAMYDLLNVHTLRPYSINQATNSRFQFDQSGQMFLAFSTSGGGSVHAENAHGFPEINFGLDSTVKWQYKSAITDPPDGSSQIYFYGGSQSEIDLGSGYVGIYPKLVIEAGATAVGNGAGISNAMGCAFLKGVVVLTAGTATVPCTLANGVNVIQLTPLITGGGLYGSPYISAINTNVSFTIASTYSSDTNRVFWSIFNP